MAPRQAVLKLTTLFSITSDLSSASNHIIFFQGRAHLKKWPFFCWNISHLARVTELQPPQNTALINMWMPTKSFIFPQHKSFLQVCVYLKSYCLQLSTASPYGPCIYEVMRPAPGVQSSHYLGDATALVVKVTRSTLNVLTLYLKLEDTKCIIISESIEFRVYPDWPLEGLIVKTYSGFISCYFSTTSKTGHLSCAIF